jgi:Mrp family chromosome partitioning ATPase
MAKPPEPPESWPETTVVPVDDLPVERGGSLKPSPIITINPPAPDEVEERLPPPPAVARTTERLKISQPPTPEPVSVQAEVVRPEPRRSKTPPMGQVAQVAQIMPSAPAHIEPFPRNLQTPEEMSMQLVSRPPPPPPTQPNVRDLLDPRLVLLLEPNSPRAAGFRLLRDNLLARDAPRVIAVTSGAIYEGKTTCAVNLALAFSEKPGKRVLLLEGNFFQPSLGRMFHIETTTASVADTNKAWLSRYKIGEITAGFHVGALVQEPHEKQPQFSSRWFELVVDHFAGGEYDQVIIDCAALDGAPTVTQIVGIADGVLLTARSGRTSGKRLRHAVEQIPQGRGLGVTLMDAAG